MAQIVFIPIVPKRLVDMGQLSAYISRGIDSETKEFERLFRNVSDGFDNEKVDYGRSVNRKGNDLVGETKTDNKVMSYLNYGTDQRWALMSDDWISKTTPHQLSAGGGGGRVVLRGQRAMMEHGLQARPGIEAREWDKEVVKVREKPFKDKIQEAITKAIK